MRVCVECGHDFINGPHACPEGRTALQEAVIRAAVAMRTATNVDKMASAQGLLGRTLDALLAAEPAWGEGPNGGKL